MLLPIYYGVIQSNSSDCSTPIRGAYETRDIVNFSDYNKAFIVCGNAFPWTNTTIANPIDLVSLNEELQEGVKKLNKNALPDLLVVSSKMV